MVAEHIPSTAARSRLRLLLAIPARRAHCRRLETAGPVFEQIGRPEPGGVTWLWTRRDLDLATVEAARRELAAFLDPRRSPGNVLVYLGSEYFVDVRGLRLLLRTAAFVRSRGGALAVVAPPHCLRRMVRLSNLDAELPLVSTARQAAWWARGNTR